MTTLVGKEAITAYQSSLPEGVVDPLDDLTEQDKEEFEFSEVSIRSVTLRMDRVMVYAETASSNSDARRKLKAGAVDVDGERVTEPEISVLLRADNPTFVLRVGRQQKRIKVLPDLKEDDPE